MKKPRRAVRRCLAAALAALLVIVIGLEEWLAPLLSTVGAHYAATLCEQTVNEVVASVLRQQNVSSGDLVLVAYDDEGQICSLSSDTVLLNFLQAEISRELLAALDADRNMSFSVPIGTALGGVFLSGRGPMISFQVIAEGTVSTDFADSFSSAGINQTYHTLSMTVCLSVLLLYAGHRDTVTVNTSVVLAQTVLVGQVPATYISTGSNKET